MYKDNQTKASISTLSGIKTYEPEREKCSYPTDNIKRRQGDIEEQLVSITNNTVELEKLLTEFLVKIEPIMIQEPACGEEKDCCKEEQISPLATDIRNVNDKLTRIKYKIVDAYKRVQL